MMLYLLLPFIDCDPNDPNPYWKQDEKCAGRTVSDDCNWRWEEMSLVTFTPKVCLESKLEGCENLVGYARVSQSAEVRLDAIY